MFDRILQKHFLNTVPENSVLLIAFSGGVDSHVLLHSLVPFKDKFQLKAIHIHHGLMPNADDWSEHCQKICDELQIDCEVVHVNVKPKKGESIEACARKARYDAFEKIMRAYDRNRRSDGAVAISDELGLRIEDCGLREGVASRRIKLKNCIADGAVAISDKDTESRNKTIYLLTGHHLDDQAETCLLQFLRGSGPRGLAAMPEITEFANGFLVRPFLPVSRQEIVEYAKKNKLKWIEDESNHDTKFARNFIRYELMPVLQKRYPSVTKSMMRVAEHAAEAEQLLQELAEIDYKRIEDCGLRIEGMSRYATDLINISKLKTLSIPRQKNVIRYWLLKQNFLMPSKIKLDHIISDVINSKEDANPMVHWEGVEIRKYQNNLYAMKPLPPHDPTKIYEWDGKSDITIPNIGTIPQSSILNPQSFCLTIRFRQGGETIQINGKTKSLKNYFQEKKIPPWERDRIPLVCHDDLIIGLIEQISETHRVQTKRSI